MDFAEISSGGRGVTESSGDASSALPPDRGGLETEKRNARSAALHTLDASACVDLMAREDERMLAAVRASQPSIVAFVEAAEPRFSAGGRLVYLGAGTSGRLGVLDASEAPPTFQVEPGRVVGVIAGGDRALRVSSEHREDDPDGAREELEALQLQTEDTVLGIASGGTTPFVRGALAIAKTLAPDCLTGFLTCTRVAAPDGCDAMIVIETGPEIITGSTRLKAGTATKLALNMISTTLMVRSGRVYENLMVDVRATNEKLKDRAARIVCALTDLDREDAFALLERCDGEVKTSIVSARLGIGATQARARLEEANDRLDGVLDDRPMEADA